MDRKLSSIQKVIALEAIPEADRIERATTLGWSCVVKKGDFSIGDLAVYIETDSVLPKDNPTFTFMEKYNYRVKTLKMKKVISQGLLMPLSILPRGDMELTEGMDVTDLLGITKYEHPEIHNPYLRGEIKDPFPSFIRKTDEPRIQTAPEVLVRHQGRLFYVSEKVDGTSFTAYLKGEDFGVCSRNLELKDTVNNVYWEIAKQYNMKEKLQSMRRGDIAVQGEIVGEGIQKNRYKLKGRRLFVFNIFDIRNSEYVPCGQFQDMCQFMGLETVPILSEIVLNHTIEDLVQMAIGLSVVNSQVKVEREGIVLRSRVECWDDEIGRLSFKAINPEYLLKFE